MTAAHLLFRSSGIVTLVLAIFSSFEGCAAVCAALPSTLILYSQFSAVGATFAAALALDRNDHFVPTFGALTVFTNCFEKCELFAVRAELSGHWLHLHEAAKECRNSMNFVYNHYIYIYIVNC